MNDVSTTTDTTAKARKLPLINTYNVRIDALHTHTKSVIVQAPDGLVPSDLNSHPEIWRVIQGTPSFALVKLDKVLIYSSDWLVDAFVAEADSTSVVLAFGKVLQLRTRSGSTWASEDGRFSIKFSGSGFGVYREDGSLASPSASFNNMQQAQGWLQATHGAMRGAA